MTTVAIPKLPIRPIGPGDVDAVCSLERLCFKDPYPPHFISQLAQANSDTFLVAVVNGDLVGYAVVNRGSNHNHLVSIAVHPNNRRGGIARRLLAVLEERLEKGRLFRLEVRKSNLPAIEFYRGQGFQETRVIEGYYSDGEDAVVMERNLRKEPGLSTQSCTQV